MKKLLFIFTFLIPFCLLSQENSTPADTSKKASNTTRSIKDVKKFPEFPGGMPKMKEYISQNLQKPKDAIQGKVYAKFTVDENGKVSEPKIIKGLNKNCDKAVIEMINKFPPFNPAVDKEGKPMICDLYLPVEFY